MSSINSFKSLRIRSASSNPFFLLSFIFYFILSEYIFYILAFNINKIWDLTPRLVIT